MLKYFCDIFSVSKFERVDFMLSKDKVTTLAIIGNGFDMAHGYRTDYKSFSESVNHPSLNKFKEFCDDTTDISTWYLFEENIKILTGRLFRQSFEEDVDYDENRKKAVMLKSLFDDIHSLLSEYLKNEIESKGFIKIPSVEKYLNNNAVAINFNYTKLAEEYTKNVHYVHGSLNEKDILLGYDYRDEPCLAQYEDMCWSKRICRESLAFRRFLKQDMHLDSESDEFKRFCNSLETYFNCENSACGIDTDPQSYIPDYNFINEFLQPYRENKELPNINYDSITDIVVLGHGIEADTEYLKTVLEKCCNLKNVIIFKYSLETDESYEKKKQFFIPYCSNIQSVNY